MAIIRKTIGQSLIILDRNKRLKILRKIRGMWKNRKPDPLKELKLIRRGWER
jgi:hypothetical protein